MRSRRPRAWRIPELFERYGEAEFRALEQRVIARILENGPQVLSTGGGAFMNEQTRDVDRRTRRFRVAEGRHRRADGAGVEEAEPAAAARTPTRAPCMERLMAERYPVYATADVTVPTRDERKEVIADEVIDALADAACGDRGGCGVTTSAE